MLRCVLLFQITLNLNMLTITIFYTSCIYIYIWDGFPRMKICPHFCNFFAASCDQTEGASTVSEYFSPLDNLGTNLFFVKIKFLGKKPFLGGQILMMAPN